MDWTKDKINYALMHPNKTADRRFLKNLAAALDIEDTLLGVNYLIMDADPMGIDLVILLLLCLYHLRTKIISWETERRRPGLSEKQYARLELKECVMNFTDADEVMKLIDYVRGGIEDGAIDGICGLVDAVHELRDELGAWAESADEAAVLQ